MRRLRHSHAISCFATLPGTAPGHGALTAAEHLGLLATAEYLARASGRIA